MMAKPQKKRGEFAEDVENSLAKPNPSSRQMPNQLFDRDAFAQRIKEIDLELPVERLPDDVYSQMLCSEEASGMYIDAKKAFEANIDAWQTRAIEANKKADHRRGRKKPTG